MNKYYALTLKAFLLSSNDCRYISPLFVLIHTYHNDMHDVTAVSFNTNFWDLKVCVTGCTGRDWRETDVPTLLQLGPAVGELAEVAFH